jgi:general secretion pathway protein A
MYESFFNLKVKPFELVPDPEFLYLSKTHRRAIRYLEYGIREKAGFILLTGEVGSGKTTLISDLIQHISRDVMLAKVFNTKISTEQLLAMINGDFGLVVQGKDKVALLNDLNNFLIQQHVRRVHTVLIIDEAQNLKPELLEEVRMISNLETTKSKLLQIVLVGQPELRETLSMPGLRQLRQRISINCHISALTTEETLEYILHRLEVAGNKNALLFADGSVDAIYQYCKGIPRLTNILCDYLLLAAFDEETREINSDMVHDIAKDLNFESLYWGQKDYLQKAKVDYSTLLSALRLNELE